MLLSINWLKDYVNIPTIKPQEFASKITLSICEVESYKQTGSFLSAVLVAEILHIEKHPKREKLSVVTVDIGKQKKTVICGADNFAVGDKVPYAPIETTLENNLTVTAKEFDGIMSEGILCAEDELGFSEEHSGLMLLDKNEVNGTTLLCLFPDQQDIILEIDNKTLTHRPDLWGHYGFAREISALFQIKFKKIKYDIQKLTGKGKSFINVNVCNKKFVPRFSALSIGNLQVRPSPLWIQHRLFRIGLRSINNLVDITNFVMLDIGQPTHAFDADALVSKTLTVKFAHENDTLITLYGKNIQLTPHDLVIYDDHQPTSLAGIIGGNKSGVSSTTTQLYLEAACWDATTIRKTSQRVAIRTDASQRFEKSQDPENTVIGIFKSIEILKLSCPNLQIYGELFDEYRPLDVPIISLHPQKVNSILGISIETQQMKNILFSLGFSITEKNNKWEIIVPSWRATRDITLAEDIIEEIGRIYGYNKIQATSPYFPVTSPLINEQRKFERKAKEQLATLQYYEIYHYPLTDSEEEKKWELPEKDTFYLTNPISINHNKMRTSLFPQMLNSVIRNKNKNTEFKIFELGKTYSKTHQPHYEKNEVMLAYYKEDAILQKIVQKMKEDLNIWIKRLTTFTPRFVPSRQVSDEKIHPLVNADIIVDKKNVGSLFTLSPQERKQHFSKEIPLFATINFDLLYSLSKNNPNFRELQKFPPAKFQITLAVPKNTYFQTLATIIENVDSYVQDIQYKDIFFPNEKPYIKYLTISMVFQSSSETIPAEKLITLQNKVVEAIRNEGFELKL